MAVTSLKKNEMMLVAAIKKATNNLKKALRTGDSKKITDQIKKIGSAKYANETFDEVERSNRRRNKTIFKKRFGKNTDKGLDKNIIAQKLKFKRENTRLLKKLAKDMRKSRNDLLKKARKEAKKQGQKISASDIRSANVKTINKLNARTKLIGRDQAATLNAKLTEIRHKNFGVTQYKWKTQRDERVRPTHNDNDRKIFRWDSPPLKTNHPGHDIFCRCEAEAVFETIGFNKIKGNQYLNERKKKIEILIRA